MTDPIQPTPGAPADPPRPATPATQALQGQPPTPPAGPDPNEPVDVAKLPPNVQNLIKTLRDEAAKTRTDAKGAASAAKAEIAREVARALGLTEEAPDPAALAEQVEQARNAAWANAVELQVFRLAASANADAEKMLDSRAFIESLDDLVDLEPSSKEFREQLKAKVQEAAAKYPAQQAPGASNGPRPDPTQGARGTPQARPTSLTEAVGAHYATRR